MTNEIRVLREFLKEFSPFYADDSVLDSMDYHDLVEAVKDTVEEM